MPCTTLVLPVPRLGSLSTDSLMPLPVFSKVMLERGVSGPGLRQASPCMMTQVVVNTTSHENRLTIDKKAS